MGGLEALAIVAALLHMSDRRAEQGRAILLGNRQQGDFTIELDKLLNDKLLDVATASVAAVLPGMLQFVGTLYERLPLPEEDISGFTTQGKPIFSAAAFSSSRDLA